MQAYAVQVVSNADITVEKRTVGEENYLSLNFIFSSLNNLATKQRRKAIHFKTHRRR